MIRWQGSTIGIGFEPRAAPTARAASGRLDPRRDRAVGRDAPERHLRGLGHDLPHERRHQPVVDAKLERVARATEVLVELPANVVGGARRRQHARRQVLGEAVLELGPVLAVEPDTRQPLRCDRHEQLADRRVDRSHRHVDQAVGRGRGPHLVVQPPGSVARLGRRHDRSQVTRLHRTRSRRVARPARTLARAASSEHPSISAISG